MTVNEKILLIRKQMSLLGVDAIIIPSTDPHQSEYVAGHWQERAFVSNFFGSAGTVVITQNHAGLWTDSRYFLQAEMELKGSEFVLHKLANQFSEPYIDYLIENLGAGKVVGVNGWMFSHESINNTSKAFDAYNIALKTNIDIISSVWHDRPSLLNLPISIHDIKYAGLTVRSKIEQVKSKLNTKGAMHYLVTGLDEIAWVLNLRGSDVPFNPVFVGYLVIGHEATILFVNPSQITSKIQNYLEENHIGVRHYNDIQSFLNKLNENELLYCDPSSCNHILYMSINCKKINGPSIIKSLKAIKNIEEQKHIHNAMIKDGAALANTFYWLEKALKDNVKVTEVELAEKLAYYRSKQPLYKGESFNAIVGYKGNGAIIHYKPEYDSCSEIKQEGILLVDSGGQYEDGTTDITRTFALSEPSPEEKEIYTAILRGKLSLSNAIFPKGTMGVQLDTLARQYLWGLGKNYLHGTGHGVGFYLNVHEPPQGFAPNLSERGRTPIEIGMLTSNEPGFYKEDKYGMRLENLIVCKPSEHSGFLTFETVTLYPYEHVLIDPKVMSASEIDQVNVYHKYVFDLISPLLEDDVKTWFTHKCRPINS